MWRHIASNAVTFLAVGLFLIGGLILWGRAQYEGDGPLAEAICLQVERGANFRRISAKLETEGAVSSSTILRMGADYAGKTSALKAGSYLIKPGASMQEIVDIITRGGASTCGTEVVYRIGVNSVGVEVRELDPGTDRFVERAGFVPGVDETPEIYEEVTANRDTRFRIAMAEGVTSWQVIEGLRAIDVLSGDIEDLPPEGALAPDSYEFDAGTERAALIAQMREKQELWVSEAWSVRDPDLPLDSPEALLTLASIIEKETGVPDERGQVASVFVNRLRNGMRLQTDPTVIYGITQGRGVLGRGLRRSELRAATPWNTYVIEGLPPTPIANPGRASLMAAAKPEMTEFLFFVADGTGGHAFATTLEEHNRNVARWREIEAQQAEEENN